MIRVTVWNEFQHERTQEKVKEIYPDGIHTCIAKFLRQEEELSVRTMSPSGFGVMCWPEWGW